ncbi:MAG: hypothetical protein WCJ92_04705 [Alphaproteobacteria bacterium]
MLKNILPAFILKIIENSFYCVGYMLLVPLFILLIIFSICMRFFHKNNECIFIGLREICSNAIDSIAALRKKYEVISFFGFFLHTYQHDSRLYNIAKIPDFLSKSSTLKLIYTKTYLLCYFFYVSFKCDSFIYFWHDSFLPLNLDYFLFYLMKKKVIVWYCGSDIRYAPIHTELMKEFGFVSNYALNEKSSNIDFLKKFYRHKLAEKFCIMHATREKGTFLKKSAIFFRTPFKLPFLGKNKKTQLPVKVCHIPSDRINKNTNVVFEAVEILKKKKVYFEFIFEECIPNARVKCILENSDILIDYAGTIWGTLACEAMTFGCVVIGANEGHFEGLKSPPIVRFPLSAQRLADVLERLIQSNKLRQYLMAKSLAYAQDELSEERYLKRIVDAFAGKLEKNVQPLPEIKKLLLKHSENKFQYLIIKLLF